MPRLRLNLMVRRALIVRRIRRMDSLRMTQTDNRITGIRGVITDIIEKVKDHRWSATEEDDH